MSDSHLKGRLLVSQPTLKDPNFDRTVIFVLQHGEDGAVGVVLNRPSDVELIETLPEWAALAAPPPKIYIGGPVVEEGTAVCLARAAGAAAAGWKPLADGIGTIDIDLAPDQVGVKVDEIRLFAGYSGWTKGQLETEIAMGGWFVVDAAAVDAFTADPAGLWKAVLARQQGILAWMATFPPDVRLN